MVSVVESIVFAIVGALGTNAVPHFVKGVTGERHMTPAGPDSSPVYNVLWGSTNAAVASILAWFYRDAIEAVTLAIVFVVSVLVALGLASYFGDDAE